MSRLTATHISRSQASKSRNRRAGGKRQKRQTDSPVIHPLLQMQQTHGNHAVGRFIQAQLKVSQPGDKYEQEADRVAEQVVNSPGAMPSQSTAISGTTQGSSMQRMPEMEEGKNELKKPDEMAVPVISRMPEGEEDTELNKKPVEGKADEEEMTPNLQTKPAAHASPSVKPSVTNNINRMQGGGTHLPKPVRAYFEPRMGADFSQVRVHADAHAADMAKSINARAFTVGRNIAFGAGEYSPDTTSGRKLLAHELTHVVQQENAIKKIQRDAIPTNLKLPCKWGDYTFEESKIAGIRILISMAEADRKSLPPLKQIAAQVESDNKIISDPKFQVKTCIISPNTTRFALYLGEPVLIIDPSDVSIETIRHEMGHALFNFIHLNKDAKINKQVKAENWIIDLVDIFLQLKQINLNKDKDNSITANFIVDPSEWNPGAKSEHPTDVDEFFASAKAAFQTDKKALTDTFIKYGKQNKTVLKLGDRLVTLLEFLFTKSKLSKQATVSDPEKIKEHLEGISEPSKVEDTLGAHPLTDMLIDPDKRKNCK